MRSHIGDTVPSQARPELTWKGFNLEGDLIMRDGWVRPSRRRD